MPKVFSCVFCSFRTNWPSNLRRHVRNNHGVSCPNCEFSTDSFGSLRSHFRTVHAIPQAITSIQEYERVVDLSQGGVAKNLEDQLKQIFLSNPPHVIASCRERTLSILRRMAHGREELLELIDDRVMDFTLDRLATHHCKICFFGCLSASENLKHMHDNHPEVQSEPKNSSDFERIQHSARGVFQIYKHPGPLQMASLHQHNFKRKIKNLVQQQAKLLGPIKWALVLEISMTRSNMNGDDEIVVPFRSKMQFVLPEEEVEVYDAITQILHHIDEFQQRGSGWVVHCIQSALVEIVKGKFQQLRGSTYIPTPPDIHGVVNVCNNDEACFKWAVLAAKFNHNFSLIDAVKPESYANYERRYNWKNLSFPLSLDKIKNFEKNNPQISINVYLYDPNGIYPCKITKHEREEHVDLLLLYQSRGHVSHYVAITDLSLLLYGYQTSQTKKRYICRHCLSGFDRQSRLDAHKKTCLEYPSQRVQMNKEGDRLSFRAWHKQLRAPYIVYADIECILEKVDTCLPNPDKTSTTILQLHQPYLVAAVLIGPTGELVESIMVEGWDACEALLHQFNRWAELAHKETKKRIKMTKEDYVRFNNATSCHICDSPFEESDVKCRDHCVATGKYRGAAHSQCNLSFKISRTLPVVFHNLQHYDGHLLVKAMANEMLDISVIPKTYENYISIQYRHKVETTSDRRDIFFRIIMIDSMQHLPASLATLAEALAKDDFQLSKKLKNIDALKTVDEAVLLEIVTRKLPFCYDYIDNTDKLDEPELPKKEAFYNTLTMEPISDKDYLFIQSVWKELKLVNLRDFLQLYLWVDIHILADVFEQYRKTTLDVYKLDPAHFLTLPALAWNAALLFTNAKLDLLTDIDMQLLFEKLKGGVAMICKRYERANNPSIVGYDKTMPDKYILDLDINSLYATCMTQPLPTSNFEWLEETQFPMFAEIDVDGEFGFVVECDLSYPRELHDSDNDFPLLPEKISITREMESDYSKAMGDAYGRCSIPKLSPNFFPKTAYVVHSTALKYYLSRGIILKKIHRVIRFKQYPWLKPFILKNIEMRKKASSKFNKDLYKLFSNAVFGKSIENVRDRQKIHLITDFEKVEPKLMSPKLIGFRIFTHNLVAVKMLKSYVLLNRPTYTGFSILDYAKVHIYSQFEMLKSKFPSIELLATDTDSLIVSVASPDPYLVLKGAIDFSNYPSSHPLFSDDRRQELGILKDEKGGIIIEEFCGLRSKVYSFRDQEGKETKRCKGIAKALVQKAIDHHLYVGTLFGRHAWTGRQTLIHCKNHQLSTVESTKMGLVPYDSKRFLLEDGIRTRAYGHYKNL